MDNNTGNFERVRLEVAGRGVTVTSWFDPAKQVWHANVPAFLHLLGNQDQHAITGITREKAIQAVLGRLAPQFAGANPGRR